VGHLSDQNESPLDDEMGRARAAHLPGRSGQRPEGAGVPKKTAAAWSERSEHGPGAFSPTALGVGPQRREQNGPTKARLASEERASNEQ